MRKSKFTTEDHLYLQVAEGIEKMISEEVLRIGDKLPSVRVLSEEYGISMGTAFQAYYHLEGKGLIEARPKSGYYVRFSQRRFPDLPKAIFPEQVSSKVSVKEMIARVYQDLTSKDMINFALAVPSYSLIPAARLNKSVINALRNSKTNCTHYEQVQGNEELRKQIALLSFNWGGKISPDEILITVGCMEALVLALQTVTSPGDTIAVECPAYFGIYQAIESMGLKVVEISSDPVTGPDLQCLEEAIKKFPIKAVLFIPNFSNPSGSLMPDENKRLLVKLVTKHGIPLIEDDIYGELYFGKNRPKTCKTYDTEGMVIHCSSISKSLSPGYRIGWIIPGKYMERVKQLKMIHTLSTPTITQAAIADFLGRGRYEYHLKQIRKSLHTQCMRYVQAIREYFPEDTKVSRPQGGFVLWLELNKNVNAYKLCMEALKHKISISPGRIFSANCNYSNYLRISYGEPWSEDVNYGLMMLGKLIQKMV